jgi:hypothetical protein
MNLRNALLGTTAILGAASLLVPSSASAFDVNIRGFFNFNVVGGDIQESLGRESRSYDFVTDSEIHIEGVNIDDETGIRYGMLVEFETDPQNATRTQGLGTADITDDRQDLGGAVIDESYIFVEGGFGGFRLGNEDGAVDNSKIGAYNIAAGTGGIDGQGVVAPVRFANVNTSDSTKIRYDSPTIAGFRIFGSFTPNNSIEGNNVVRETVDYEDWVETALTYTNSFGGLDLQLGGTYGFNQGKNGQDDYQGYNLGAILGFAGIQGAGSFWHDNDGPDGDTTGYTLGAAATLGPADLSVTWADITDADNNEEGNNLVLSGSVGVLPGLSLNGDVAWFDRDAGGNDDGVTGVVRLRVAF